MNKTGKSLCVMAAFLAASFSAFAATWEKPVPSEVSLVSGEEYYLYNYDAVKFLDVSGMQTAPTETGRAFLFEKQSSGDWTMYGSDGYLYADLDYVGCNGGDGESGSIWCIEKQASGAYYLRPSKSDPTFSWTAYPDMWTGISYATGGIVPLIKTGDGALDWYFLPVAKYALWGKRPALDF